MTEAPRTTDQEVAATDDWTKIALHCQECGVQFFRKVKAQRYCDEHRHLAGAAIKLSMAGRLREAALAYGAGGESLWYKAADEIERLRTALEQLQSACIESNDLRYASIATKALYGDP